MNILCYGGTCLPRQYNRRITNSGFISFCQLMFSSILIKDDLFENALLMRVENKKVLAT